MKTEKETKVETVVPMDVTFYYEGVYTHITLEKDGSFTFYDSTTDHTRFPFANLVAFCKAGGKVVEPVMVKEPEPDRKVRCVECKHLDWSKVKIGRAPCLQSSGHMMWSETQDIFLKSTCYHFTPAPVGCGNADQAMLQELIRIKEMSDDD